jgi:RNA polymerase sigma-70 factor (ECF subfamily)
VRQTVLLRLARSPHSIRNPERIAAWLRRAVVREAIASVRKRTRRRRLHAWLQFRASDRDDKSDPPDQILERSEEAARLKAVLVTLSPEDRALLSLRFDEDLSFAEIGDVLGVPASTLKSRMKPLLARVRSLLGGPEHE